MSYLLCIDTPERANRVFLTTGMVYKVEKIFHEGDIDSERFIVVNDDGYERKYFGSRFRKLTEVEYLEYLMKKEIGI